MPGFVAHYIFGVNTFKALNDREIRAIIKKHHNAYSLGLQGPDLFFYFVPTSIGIKPNIANMMHKQNTGKFLNQLIASVASIENIDDFHIAAAYILGYMGHYILDVSVHPYVYARVGTVANQRTLGKHFGLETDMDREILYKYKGLRPNDFSHADVIRLSDREKNVIARILSTSIMNTYEISITPTVVKAAVICFYVECALISDKKMYKHRAIRFIENNLMGYELVSSLLINENAHTFDACNLTHEVWTNPWDNTFSYDDSVFDMIDDNSTIYSSYIPMMYDALNKSFKHIYNPEPPIMKLLGNRSMTSGLDCNIELKR